jgi:hypothetical protein
MLFRKMRAKHPVETFRFAGGSRIAGELIGKDTLPQLLRYIEQYPA